MLNGIEKEKELTVNEIIRKALLDILFLLSDVKKEDARHISGLKKIAITKDFNEFAKLISDSFKSCFKELREDYSLEFVNNRLAMIFAGVLLYKKGEKPEYLGKIESVILTQDQQSGEITVRLSLLYSKADKQEKRYICGSYQEILASYKFED